jgi:hypothetical protein
MTIQPPLKINNQPGIPGRPAVVASSIKLGRGCVNSPVGERDFEALHRRQSFGDTFSRALQISFGDRDPGICFPRQRLPSALCGIQRNLEKPLCLSSRLPQGSLRKPKFRQRRFEHHAGVPVKD